MLKLKSVIRFRRKEGKILVPFVDFGLLTDWSYK